MDQKIIIPIKEMKDQVLSYVRIRPYESLRVNSGKTASKGSKELPCSIQSRDDNTILIEDKDKKNQAYKFSKRLTK